MEGYAAETSGGLLIAISQEKKEAFVRELKDNNINNW